MCKYRFISCNSQTTLVENTDSGADDTHLGGSGAFWDRSVPSSKFCCDPKSALKNSLKKINS